MESIEYPGIADLRARLARAEAIADKLVKLNANMYALRTDPIIIHACVEANLQSKLDASHKREQILLDGIRQYADRRNWTGANARSRMKDSWVPGIFGYDIAEATIKAAAEVNA